MVFADTMVVVYTDAFRQDEFYPFFSYTFAEMDEFGGVARKRRHKLMHATKVLKICVLAPLLDN